MSDETASRKSDHLRIAREEAVESRTSASPWCEVKLVYQALPEVDLGAIDTSVRFLGKRLSLPLLIGAMTGGTEEARRINRTLAEAAQATGIGMGLGSQRIMLETPESRESFAVRDVAPDILLLANLGAVQLNLGVGPEQAAQLVHETGADGLALHLNASQEAIQPEGDTQFAGLTERMRETIPQIGVPVGVKEVGGGFSRQAVERLATMELAWLESAGQGGTSWTRIEGLRAPSEAGRALGELFAEFGVSSVESLQHCLAYGGGTPVIASGGLRNGLDAVKALALGARLSAMALPMLKAAAHGTEAVIAEIEAFRRQLRTAMFLVGADSLEALHRVPLHGVQRTTTAKPG